MPCFVPAEAVLLMGLGFVSAVSGVGMSLCETGAKPYGDNAVGKWISIAAKTVEIITASGLLAFVGLLISPYLGGGVLLFGVFAITIPTIAGCMNSDRWNAASDSVLIAAKVFNVVGGALVLGVSSLSAALGVGALLAAINILPYLIPEPSLEKAALA